MASQRSNKRIKASAFRSALRWMLPCSRATTSASSLPSVGTRRRSHTFCKSFTLRPSWPMWRGSTSAGVLPLPRSCIRQATRTDSGVFSRAAMSITSIMCTPVSTSGWYSARWGTPHRRSNSGSKTLSAPHARSTSNILEGRSLIRPLASSCQTRSGTKWSTSPSSTIWRINTMVSSATEKSAKRAAKRANRRMRTGSSANACVTWRSTLACKSRWPP